MRGVLWGAALGLFFLGLTLYQVSLVPTPKALKVFLFVFESGESKEFLGDTVEQRGNCSVIITERKPVIWLCNIPHMILPLGPKVPETPKPEPTPTSNHGGLLNERA
jgi:hypothetical protein